MTGRPAVNLRQLNVRTPGGTVHARAADTGLPACMRVTPALRACARWLEPTGDAITCQRFECRYRRIQL